DVVVMPAVPRFLSPGDSLVVPVSLMNTTQKSGSIQVKLETEGPLSITGNATQSINLSGKDNQNLKFGIQCANTVGTGKIKFRTSGLDNVEDEIEIAVRPTSPLVVEEDAGSIKAGTSEVLRIPQDFIAKTQKSKLTISKFPAIQYAGHLGYLVRYPHGCVEQTTSKLFPQLYFEDLVTAVDPSATVRGNPVYFINAGIRKLQSMQLGDGALSYWPGRSYASNWGSVYAAHFLVEAKKAGYDVSETVLNRLLTYLGRLAAEKGTYNYRRYTNGQLSQEVRARKEVAYALYVLALADRGDLSLMNYYRARLHLLTGDSRYLLAGAFGLMNKWTAFKEVLPEMFLAETPVRESGGAFDSEVRANAMMLQVLLDVDPTN
ncbi:MAG: hypothetical protein AAF570_27925, partial [Bacteroidota bacterium]